MAAPSVRAVGNIASGTGDVTVTPPATHQSGDIEYLIVESSNGTTCSLGTAAGFASLGQSVAGEFADGTTCTVFWRRWNGTDGSPTITDPGNHAAAYIVAIQDAIASGTPHEGVTTSNEQVEDTSGSASGASSVSGSDRLALIAVTVAKPDGTDSNSATNFSGWTNSNLGSLTERFDGLHSAGNGGGFGLASGTVTTPASGVGTTTYTIGTASYKAMVTWAVLPVATDNRNATLSITGGGSAAFAATHNRNCALAVSGGGSASLPYTHNRNSILGITGGGSFTFVYETSNNEKTAILAITGGGSASFVAEKQAFATLGIAGGGSVAFSVTHNRSGALTITGGGLVGVTVVPGRQLVLSIGGGGSVTIEATSSEQPEVTLTVSGGGRATITGGKNLRVVVLRTVLPLGPNAYYTEHEEVFGTTPRKTFRGDTNTS